MSVRRMSRSSVPCRCALYSRSDRFRIDILPECEYTPSRRMSTRDDFPDEIRAHLEIEAARPIAEALTPEAARLAARHASREADWARRSRRPARPWRRATGPR